MFLQPILALLLIRYLRNSLKTAAPSLFPKWKPIFKAGFVLSIALIILTIIAKGNSFIIMWISYLLVIAIVFLILYQKEFQFAKLVLYAVLPLIIVSLIEDSVALINSAFHKTWENYFNAAATFAFFWMVAMLIVNHKQRKALEKERLKAEEKEKEFKITETLKAELEVQVTERTAALTLQKEELEHTLDELKSTQALLIQSEKMASLGELTAGIAHEIQNPLNFVNNFSEVSNELIGEMMEAVAKGNYAEVQALADDVKQNLEKINHHGRRADAIVKGMLQHSRSSSAVKEPTDINKLADEYLRLAYHGLRAKDKSFNAIIKTDFDESLSAGEDGTGKINIIPQDIGRVILNLITNAFYAVTEKKKQASADYEPEVSISTKKLNGNVEIRVRDNGMGIPQKIMDKIFQPFFTTKPAGKGTGLGLSVSYDIITKGHGGELKVETLSDDEAGREGEGSEFIIKIPA